jgi:hypothetical protein
MKRAFPVVVAVLRVFWTMFCPSSIRNAARHFCGCFPKGKR